VLNEHNTVFASKQSAICNRCFPGPTRVFDANDISMQGSIDDRPTNRPIIDHVTRSITIGGIYVRSDIVLRMWSNNM